MNKDEIGDYIESVIETIKPEVKARFVYQITDEADSALAITYLGLNPVFIKFYVSSIYTLPENKEGEEVLKARIKRIISHEISHVFGSDEHTANQRQRMNIYEPL